MPSASAALGGVPPWSCDTWPSRCPCQTLRHLHAAGRYPWRWLRRRASDRGRAPHAPDGDLSKRVNGERLGAQGKRMGSHSPPRWRGKPPPRVTPSDARGGRTCQRRCAFKAKRQSPAQMENAPLPLVVRLRRVAGGGRDPRGHPARGCALSMKMMAFWPWVSTGCLPQRRRGATVSSRALRPRRRC